MHSIHRAATLALCALLAGCAIVHTVRLGPERYAPIDPSEVRIFATVAPKSYTEVAILTGISDVFQNEARLAEKMRRTAARLGANGILLASPRHGYAGGRDAGAADSNVVVAPGPIGDFGRVVAIRYDASAEGVGSGTAGVASRKP